MERVLIINGCSHSAGSEIPGEGIGDGRECRDQSFGALLAAQLDRKPVHLALPGGSNEWILRSSIAWVGDNLDKIRNKEIDVKFLVHWSGAERWEYRFPEKPFMTPFIDYEHDHAYRSFSVGSINNMAGLGSDIFKIFTKMFATGSDYWSDNKLKNVLSLQSFLQVHQIPYFFGNAFDTFIHTKTYLSMNRLINRKYYPYLGDKNNSYYWLCKNVGFENMDKNNKLWHLGAAAHEYYAQFLHKEFIRLDLTD
jgi:hypothetical protein